MGMHRIFKSVMLYVHAVQNVIYGENVFNFVWRRIIFYIYWQVCLETSYDAVLQEVWCSVWWRTIMCLSQNIFWETQDVGWLNLLTTVFCMLQWHGNLILCLLRAYLRSHSIVSKMQSCRVQSFRCSLSRYWVAVCRNLSLVPFYDFSYEVTYIIVAMIQLVVYLYLEFTMGHDEER